MAFPSLEGPEWGVFHYRHLMTAQDRLTANINELLRFTRRRQIDLATHLGLSQPQVSNLLSGKRTWQLEDLDKIADFFCVSVPSLFVEGTLERRAGRERRSGLDRRDRYATAADRSDKARDD